ncbi:bifunctional 2-polyprenyl-6-hydroxyphenol methylase/3-demethylubiquinol 3-O-methyltransferase UbiG [Beijerinckia indica]|uniref:Ubiquinone biosynthesis O-methyltransferase n=1 Tax=Beijerinckia indica subsp. indica (strain ATCC 9039 / DSM 1715 / NCIMB 8712) TaxID=395963 RepID=B2IF68_BEII9|nr:bifunctional 2-polyprenyl-6-hydroxyphenol methylase/3-demethylubiquinol 3-O-methyltransferase UbiG [Beijerinckia indica]ACB95633.1 ubiquinone biosynthesis O-methyltransferase [Beijerinckia indica subsp. indica ATCC 9039]
MVEEARRRTTVDAEDVARFDRVGGAWWDPQGPMAALHAFNPVRIAYLRDLLCRHFPQDGQFRDRHAAHPLQGLRLLDIGCGAGLLSEPLARLGASMTAIDPAPHNIEVARAHAETSGLAIDYRCMRVEDLDPAAECFDAVLTMEVLEHVADVPAFLKYAADLVRPGGLLIAATLNRTLKSFALAIVGAEYILRWVEPGTHQWRQFITPEELTRMLRANGLTLIDRTGASYDPLRRQWRLSHDLDINYMLAARR